MSFLELRQVSKSYGAGATEVHALSDVDLVRRAWLARGGDGAERVGQVHPAHDRREPGGPDER